MTRRYLPTTLALLAEDWAGDGPRVLDPVIAADDAEETEYAALMDAADVSAGLVADLPDGQRRRVVVVAETATADAPATWRDVVAVHVDSDDDADPDDDLAWWATQEVGDLLGLT
ncbi:hypothetical protein F4692_000388 [Nocardioides cavernae]|uniref:Uncharacterized protein n=1 Tax=Nocardioides cavernae TaxID=1921566 RepID=A0A7Y9GZL9_9ACTN|nr:hypothetical protein [Nocardioides cavernae]NYE35284.1 hypothetical protein [Nocardioides cavernae]